MLALLGALFFLVALLIALFAHHPFHLVTIFALAGLLVTAIHHGGVGPRTFSKFW